MKKITSILVMSLLMCVIFVNISDAQTLRIGEAYRNGFKIFFDNTTYETVHVLAPFYTKDEFNYAVLDTNTAQTFTEDSSGTVYGLSKGGWFIAPQVNSGTAVILDQQLGMVRLTTGTSTDDDVEIASSDSMYHGDNCLAFEARIRISNIDTTSFFIGFSNTDSTGADSIDFFFDADTIKACGLTTDGFGFVWDTDATNDYLYAFTAEDDTVATRISSATALVANTWYILRAELDANGSVKFFMDGAYIGASADAALKTSKGLFFKFAVLSRGSVLTYTYDLEKLQIWSGR